jgi:hypothetical protein
MGVSRQIDQRGGKTLTDQAGSIARKAAFEIQLSW